MSLYDELYDHYTSDVLLEYVKLCGSSSKLTRKAERAEFLASSLLDPERLRHFWQQMDDLSQKAVTAAYYNGGVFNSDAFVAQYGALPQRPKRSEWSLYGEPMLLDLFFQVSHFHSVYGTRDNCIPADLMPLLAGLVPPRDLFQLAGVAEIPVLTGEDGTKLELILVETEEAGWHDLLLFLQLIEQGIVKYSAASEKLTAASARTLVEQLLCGDFPKITEGATKFDDTIRVFGLATFAAGANWISAYGKGRLTEQGREFLTTQAPETLLSAFETWTTEGKYDELYRIDAIKGMRSKGIRLTRPGYRRERIVEALSWCPTGVWIAIEDFYRALKIWRFDFEVEEGGIGKLYVGYRYGWGGYYEEWASHDDMWRLINGLYINALLWEYLGTIGAVDLLYLSPEDASLDAAAYDFDEEFYSRYDGLLYFRINPLGAYLFGQAGDYTPPRPADETLFRITPDRRLVLRDKMQLTPVHTAQLDQFAVAAAANEYHLDAPKLLAALEQGAEYEAIHQFFTRHHHGPLLPEIESWLAQVYDNSRGFAIKSKALMIRAVSADLVQLILADSELGKFSQAIDSRTVVIPASRETRFRNRLRELGYGLH